MDARIEGLAARISEALERGERPVLALRAAMERAGPRVGRVELIAAWRIATRVGIADANVIGAWHVFGERLSDDALDAGLTARLGDRSKQ